MLPFVSLAIASMSQGKKGVEGDSPCHRWHDGKSRLMVPTSSDKKGPITLRIGEIRKERNFFFLLQVMRLGCSSMVAVRGEEV